MSFTVDELLAWAARHEGDEWFTLHRPQPFRYRVTPFGIQIITRKGKSRRVSKEMLETLCDQFHQSGSYVPSTYHRNWSKSYLLALIRRFRAERGEGARS